MKNSIFARFARAFFIFWHFEDVLVLSTTWNDLFCSCVDNVSIWWQMFNFVFLCPKRWFQFNVRIVRTHFSSVMTWKLKNDYRNFRMTFLLSSTSCLLKLPNKALVSFCFLPIKFWTRGHLKHSKNFRKIPSISERPRMFPSPCLKIQPFPIYRFSSLIAIVVSAWFWRSELLDQLHKNVRRRNSSYMCK